MLLPWAELHVKSQHEGAQVSQMDEAAGPYCQLQYIKLFPLMASWAGCSQHLEEKNMLHPSLFLPLMAQEK